MAANRLITVLAEHSMPLVFALVVASGAVPAMTVLDVRGGIAFGMIASCWLLLARPIVAGTLGFLISGKSISLRGAWIIGNVVVDLLALFVTVSLLPELLPSILAVIMTSELFYVARIR